MTASTLLLFFFATLILLISPKIRARIEETGLVADALQWPMAMSMYADLEEKDELDNEETDDNGRRSLFWRRVHHYYISYGALAANRIPCPPRSGRSYYTHNCFKTRAPANPYTRGCSSITRCRR